jgi:hypothetical protein
MAAGQQHCRGSVAGGHADEESKEFVVREGARGHALLIQGKRRRRER